MAKKVNAIEERLNKIYALQVIDSSIDQIQILKGQLPMEVSDLEDEITGLNTRIEKLTGTIDDVKTEITNHNTNIKTSEALIERYNKQLDDVKNNREYDLEIELSNKKIKDSNFSKENKTETLNAAKEKRDLKVEDLDKKKVELEKIIAKTDKEERKYKKQSNAARGEIDARFLKSYDKIRGRYRNGLGVVTIIRNSCGGCFNRIPPQIQIEIDNRKDIIPCEHCGRILVDNEIAGLKEEATA